MANYQELIDLLNKAKEDKEPNMSVEPIQPEIMEEAPAVPMMSMPDPSAPQEAKQAVVDKELNSEVASPNAASELPVAQGQETSSIQDLMKKYLSGREGHEEALSEARKEDKNSKLIAALGKNLSQFARADSQSKVGQQLKDSEFSTMTSDKVGEVEGDRANKLKELLTAKKLQDITKDKSGLTEYQKEALKLRGRELDIKEKKATSETESKGELSKGQIKADQEFAKTYQEYVAAGGSADSKKQLEQLKDARDMLLSGKVEATGPILGSVGKYGRDILAPKGASIEDKVAEVVQRNLRVILGAQFTEKEGTQLLARAYNPRLSEKENAKRVGALVDQMDQAIKAKEEASRYFEDNGTLKGFRGKSIRETMGLSKAMPSSESKGGETVLLQSPDGQTKRVRKDKAQKYIEKGAKVIGQ